VRPWCQQSSWTDLFPLLLGHQIPTCFMGAVTLIPVQGGEISLGKLDCLDWSDGFITSFYL
jgi:hypothetical protein